MKYYTKISLVFVCLFSVIFNTACWQTSDEGTVTVQTIYGAAKQVIRPESGGIWTIWTWGDEYHSVNMRSITQEIPVSSATMDNARFKWTMTYTAKPINTDDTILGYVRKFGLTEEERHQRRDPILQSQAQTVVSNVMSNYQAYDLQEKKEEIRIKVQETLKVIFHDQAFMDLESVQISGNPDFDDDRIDNAAGAVVAASKEKEAETERKLAAQAAKERKEIEAQTAAISLADPRVYELERQRIALEIEKARADGIAKHQGNLTLVFGNSDSKTPQIQLKTQ